MRRIITLPLLLLTVCSSCVAAASTLADPVHYWHEDARDAQETDGNLPRENWEAFLNPDRIEFWREGDYTPPMPLVWAMRHPTTENIQHYLSYLTLRASKMATFQEALVQARSPRIAHVTVAFRSDCSACHAFLTELVSLGLPEDAVTLLQVDQKPIRLPSLPWRVVHLSVRQAAALRIDMVPTVWVKTADGDTRRLGNPSELFEAGGLK